MGVVANICPENVIFCSVKAIAHRKLCPSGYVARMSRRQNTGHIPGKKVRLVSEYIRYKSFSLQKPGIALSFFLRVVVFLCAFVLKINEQSSCFIRDRLQTTVAVTYGNIFQAHLHYDIKIWLAFDNFQKFRQWYQVSSNNQPLMKTFCFHRSFFSVDGIAFQLCV